MTNPPATTALYTANEVEQRTGVPATTLRQWERRYGFPSPSRTAGGYRMYSPFDLACIAFIQARQDEGVPASRAVELARDHFVQSPVATAPGENGAVDALVQALIRPDLREAATVLAEAQALLGTEDMMMQVIGPALGRIGTLWEHGEITVAHEHQASAFLKARLGLLLDAAGLNEFGPVMVAACGPGEYHETGLMMLSVVLRRRGIQVHYLGSDTPLADLAVYTRAVGARALLISLNTLGALERFLAEADDLRGLGVPVCFGGQMLIQRPALAQELGGEYLGSTATQAAQAVAHLLVGTGRE